MRRRDGPEGLQQYSSTQLSQVGNSLLSNTLSHVRRRLLTHIISRYPLPKSLPSGEGMRSAHPLGPFTLPPSLNPSPRGRGCAPRTHWAFNVTPSLNPSPRGRDLLSLQAVKKIGVSQMRNLSSLISQSQAFFSLQTPASPTLTSQSYIKICDLYARPIRKKPLPNKSQIISW